MTTGAKRARTKFTVGLALAAAGSGVALAPGAHAAAKYQNGTIGWSDLKQWNVANPDGSGQHTVTPSGGGYDASVEQIKVLAYSHDGTHAAFLTLNSTTNRATLWTSKADGTDTKKLSDANPGLWTPLTWSADDSAVYYTFMTGPTVTRIFAAPIDGSAPHPLFTTPDDYIEYNPTVAPDGRVAFIRSKAAGSIAASLGVYVLAPGATTPQLVPGTAGVINASFSPDGSKLALVIGTLDAANPLKHHFRLTVMNADGTDAADVFEAPIDDVIEAPSWSPDGSKIAWWQSDRAAATGTGTPGELRILAAKPGSVPQNVVNVANSGDYQVSWQAGKAGAATRPVLDRIGGQDRRGTAIAASAWSYDAAGTGGRQANVAVLSRDDQFADALSGNALAAQKHGPLLLTGTAALDEKVKAELQRVLAPGSTVYILGGEKALSPAVEQAVKDAGFTPKRLQGGDRYTTSVAIAKEVAPNGPHSALVATGANFPDALTAGAAAAQDLAGGVVLLSQDGVLPQATKDYLGTVDPHKTTVYGVGGQGVTALKTAFPAWDGLTVPLAGSDRYGTAYQVAHSKLFGLDTPVTIAGVATAGTWPDALSGGALIAAQHGPLLLAGPGGLSAEETSVLTANHLSGLAVFGGTKAVPDAVAKAAADAAFGAGAWDSADDRVAPALP